jgi:hypothetical protein
MGWRGFGFVHHSRTLFCRAVPNPNITIRTLFIAVQEGSGRSPQSIRKPLLLFERTFLFHRCQLLGFDLFFRFGRGGRFPVRAAPRLDPQQPHLVTGSGSKRL